MNKDVNYVRCKICGITNKEDAKKAIEAGADALGLIMCKSPRQVSKEAAKELLEGLPPYVGRVLVVQDMSKEKLDEILEYVGLFDTIQFHGDESEDFCISYAKKYKVVKTILVSGRESVERLLDYKRLSYFLLDTGLVRNGFNGGMRGESSGGTGVRFDWELGVYGKGLLEGGSKIILAGGLNPGNVSDAIKKVKPYGVDVSSGVELARGRKDIKKLYEFIKEVRKGY